MIRKNKALSRCYLGIYLVWIFASWIAPFLFGRDVPALTIIFIVINCLNLAGIIVSHVFKNKNKFKPFLISSAISIGVLTVVTLVGFIMEIAFTVQGQPATYAWVISSIGVAIMALVVPFTIRAYYQIAHPVDYSLKVEDMLVVKEQQEKEKENK